MSEFRRILLDGAIVEVERAGERLTARDGRAVAPDEARHLPPSVPSKIIAVHLNHVSRVREFMISLGATPTYFQKCLSSLNAHRGAVVRPRGCRWLNYEGEVAIVMARRCRNIAKDEAPGYIAGYTICNDVSERHFQIERSGQWMKGKCCETFGPLGPWLVTPDEIADPQNLDMFLDVNGKRMQSGNTKTMIFGCHHLMHYISQFMVLEPGDVIVTGTPPGVALGMKPEPKFLKAGDVVTLGIDGLGEQKQKIAPARI